MAFTLTHPIATLRRYQRIRAELVKLKLLAI